MKFDVTQAVQKVQQLLPWDLVLVVDGQEYSTRPLTLADMGVLQQIGSAKVEGDSPEAAAEIAAIQAREGAFIANLFVDPVPPVGHWDGETKAAVLSAVFGYFQERSRKNAQVIAAQVATAMSKTRATTAGSRPASTSGKS